MDRLRANLRRAARRQRVGCALALGPARSWSQPMTEAPRFEPGGEPQAVSSGCSIARRQPSLSGRSPCVSVITSSFASRRRARPSSRAALRLGVLAAGDTPRALDSHRDVLGFEVTWSWGDPILRAGVARDGFELQLAGAQTGSPGPSFVYSHVTDVDGYDRMCRERGANIETELADRPFLLRDFRVLDPSGNRLGFGEPIRRRDAGV